MENNKNEKRASFIEDIEKLQKIEQELYDKLKSIGTHTKEPVKCATGFSGPNKKGECTSYWSSDCDLDCHKRNCASSGGKWIEKNFWENPYTCKPQEKTGDRELSENRQEKLVIMKKINEISKLRLNLYQRLKNRYNDKYTNTLTKYSHIKDKVRLLYNTEKKMNEIKKEINKRKHLLENKIRVLEINDKLLEEEMINKKILKTVFTICILLVLAILVSRFPFIPKMFVYPFMVLILVIGLYKLIVIKYYQHAERGLHRLDYYSISKSGSDVVGLNTDIEESSDLNNALAGLKDDYSSLTDGRIIDNTIVEFDEYEGFTPNDMSYISPQSSV